MTRARPMAVILAGGIAKGAFEAGALEVLTARGLQIGSIVATSSGALNGALLAAGVRSGRAAEAGRRLVALWQDHASWWRIFRVSARDALGGRGLLSSEKVFEL